MKLYFYFLETNKIRTEECEVEEKPKTYKPVDKFPEGYYGCYVKKEDIGALSSYDNNTVILTEDNRAKAAEIFSGKCIGGIARAKSNIQSAESRIEEYNSMLKMIEEWRSVE